MERNVAEFESSVESSLLSSSIQIDQNRPLVLDLLLKGVSKCDPHIHPNAALKLKQQKKQQQLKREDENAVY